MSEEDETYFIHFEGLKKPDGEDAILSRAAFMLHTSGIMNSYGSPGFVPDEYLNAISAETTTTVAELEAAGLWLRSETEEGYLVLDREMVKMQVEIRDRMAAGDDEDEQSLDG